MSAVSRSIVTRSDFLEEKAGVSKRAETEFEAKCADLVTRLQYQFDQVSRDGHGEGVQVDEELERQFSEIGAAPLRNRDESCARSAAIRAYLELCVKKESVTIFLLEVVCEDLDRRNAFPFA